MKKNYTFRELMERLDEYVKNPNNHEFCTKGKRVEVSEDEWPIYCKTCNCNLYNHIEQFLLWVRNNDLKEEI